MFENLASDYDLMNDVISFGMHKSIKKKSVSNIFKLYSGRSELKILDVCCGTGDIAIFAAEKFGDSAKITGVDFSESMLEIAKKRSAKYKNIEYITADVLNLPFEDNYFDAVFISFGLRNLADLKKGVLELKRVTKNGGYVSNLDVGKPEGICGKLSKLYFYLFVPVLGKLIHGNAEPYSYLHESREEFPSQKELITIFSELGFKNIKNNDFALGTIAQQIAQA